MRDSLYVFPDTNIFLHYPPLSQIDWQALCDATNVHLVICLQVIHELDDKKSDSRLADRAVRAIKEIRAATDTGQPLREGVTLSIFEQDIRLSDFPAMLSPESGDDRIVHLARMYRDKSPSHDVAIATEDLGMELRCKAGGVTVLPMDTAKRLSSPQDELTKKYKQAVTELNSLRNRLPKLTLLLSTDERPVTFDEGCAFELPNSYPIIDIDGELAKVKETYPQQAGLVAYGNRMGIVPPILGTLVSQEQWREYDQKLEEFYSDYRLYLEQCNTLAEVKSRSITFKLWLCNIGNGPANDIDADITIPAQVCWMAQKGTKEAKAIKTPQPPKPPEKPEPHFASLMRRPELALPRMVPLDRRVMGEQWNGATVQKQADNSHIIHARLQKLKHGHNWDIGTFIAVFGRWKDGLPFQAPFTISTSELPDHVTGNIPFVVRVRTSHT